MTRLRAICLAGPTGVGKTAAALALARAVDGEVINTDSRQVYADFPLITAQPSPEERAEVPHHLYGCLPTTERITAGRWRETALDIARDVAARGKTPLFVGGTGLYFRALLEGMAAIPPVPAPVHAAVVARCAGEGLAAMYAALRRVDPEAAARIHPHNRQRVARALEVYEATGKPLSWWHSHAATPAPCEGLYLGLATTLEALTPRLARRIEVMLAAGALDEARAALAHCPDRTAPGWTGIGCAELGRHVAGEIDLGQCVELWLRHTRRYAKRQLTWFRAVPGVLWHEPTALTLLCQKAQKFLCR